MDELFTENRRTAPVADEREYVHLGPLETESGGYLPDVKVAYETWGTLSPTADNAVLVCHAVSGDSHAIGWWNKLIGPGKAVDTDRFFVIGNNLLGGCQGTTGPSSLAPDGKPYSSRFPMITIRDMVEVQARLVRSLGISSLHAAIGGSMGGFLSLEWACNKSLSVRKVFASASCARSNAMQIGFHETARQAVMRDPRWLGGNYKPDEQPADGLAVARMIGHLTYLSPQAFEGKFGRRRQAESRNEERGTRNEGGNRGAGEPEPGPSSDLPLLGTSPSEPRSSFLVPRSSPTNEQFSPSQDPYSYAYTFAPEFQVEGYLKYQAEGFTKRFDANSFLYISRAMDYFNLPDLSGATADFLFASFASDWMYPPALSEELHQMALDAGCHSRHLTVDLPFGHDSFLLDGEVQAKALREFLA